MAAAAEKAAEDAEPPRRSRGARGSKDQEAAPRTSKRMTRAQACARVLLFVPECLSALVLTQYIVLGRAVYQQGSLDCLVSLYVGSVPCSSVEARFLRGLFNPLLLRYSIARISCFTSRNLHSLCRCLRAKAFVPHEETGEYLKCFSLRIGVEHGDVRQACAPQ